MLAEIQADWEKIVEQKMLRLGFVNNKAVMWLQERNDKLRQSTRL